MATKVWRDAELDTSGLYEPDAMRSFGPVVYGAERYAILIQFVGNAPLDPAVMAPHELDQLWEMFKAAVEAGAELPDVPEAEPDAAPASVPDSGAADGPAGSAAAEQDTPASDVPAPAQAGPPAAMVACPRCDGFGTVASGTEVVTCPQCNGERTVAAG